MLRFRLGSIPIEVHLSHLVASFLLAFLCMPGRPEEGGSGPHVWPYSELLHPGGPGYARTLAVCALLLTGVISLAALVHELGHALAGRAFGYRPSISLAWLGGHTRPSTLGSIPWHRDVVLTAAGPLAGLLLGLGALGAHHQWGERSEGLAFVLWWVARVNLAWAVVNLLPVLPMDGGRIVSTLATRLLGRPGFLAAQGLALVVCAALVALAVALQSPLLGGLFILLGLRTLRVLASGLESLPALTQAHAPLLEALEQAQQALAAGQLGEARRLCVRVLEAEQAPLQLASRAHLLLGWVSLKEGLGRAALDHFSQVHRQPVETQALAAAFSLIGDELRALPLWEMAWRERRDRTVLHEYAGALIRSGLEAQALRLPELDVALAFSCAVRVLAIRGAWSEAGALGESALAHVPRPELAYEAACAYAQARMLDNALRLLHRASALGFRDRAYAVSDADLAPLHGHPHFEAWVTGLQESASA